MAKFFRYYNPYTGYYYGMTEHAKLRIWERFRTLDIDREFKCYHWLMVQKAVDDEIIANMEVGDEAIIKYCPSNKVYVIVLSEDLTVTLKTVFKDSYFSEFTQTGKTIYKVYRDGSVHKWIEDYSVSPFHY